MTSDPLTLFGAQAVDAPSTKVRRDAPESSVQAARKAVGRTGSWRDEVFHVIAIHGRHGATSIEIEQVIAQDHPCHCGCTHRAPVGHNVIAARLQELREWGWVKYTYANTGEVLMRQHHGRGANIHILTVKGIAEAKARYGIGYY